jgi:alpha-D-ribose 1-methylphosphonate 5-phosphate C-P lyase
VIRAIVDDDVSGLSEFSIPLFERVQWPNECITCGADSTHTDEASVEDKDASAFLVGELSMLQQRIA